MLRRPWIAIRGLYLRSFAIYSTPSSGRLETLLSPGQTQGKTSPNPAPTEATPTGPPQAPAGSLPPSNQSQTKASSKAKKKHRLPGETSYHLHVVASRNNTILTFTNELGNPCAWISSGLCGFKNVQRSGYEAGYQCAVKMFEKIAEIREKHPGDMRIEILFKGTGAGREALYRALMATEGEHLRDTIVQLTDTTPLKVGGGTRAKKARRL